MLTLPGCVLIVLYQPGQTEVGDLAHQILAHKNVGCPQVPVNVVHPLNESHAVCNLKNKQHL